MSSINLDLDFQDYAPSASGGGNRTEVQQPGVQVRIPSPAVDGNTSGLKQNIQTAKSVLNIVQNLASPQSGQAGGLSNETIQQLIWLSNKQKNKNQRSSIAAKSGWGLGYLAQYFDVTAEDVLQRIIWSTVPIRKTAIDVDRLDEPELTAPLASNMAANSDSNPFSPETNPNGDIGGETRHYSFMERFIQSRPDFYGPFWISTTLVFVAAIFSNIVSYSNHKAQLLQFGQPGSSSSNTSEGSMTVDALDKLESWHYSLDELNMTASLVTLHVILIPTFLWFLFWFQGCTKYYTLTETICAYGYSLSIFIPLAALLMVQTLIFRYAVLLLAASLSGLVLVMSFLPIVHSNRGRGASHVILIIVMICQVGGAYILHRIMLQ